jgi:hypothetical protein
MGGRVLKDGRRYTGNWIRQIRLYLRQGTAFVMAKEMIDQVGCEVAILHPGMINLLHGLFLHPGITTVVGKDLAMREKREEAIRQLDG